MKVRHLLIGIALVGLAWGAISCTTSSTDPVTAVPVDLQISFKPTALTTLIDYAELRIVYLQTDDTLYEYPTVTKGMILDTLVLLPGNDVQLCLTALHDTLVLYAGCDTIDVVAGSTVVSTIYMEPVASVSMLAPSPLYQEISLSREEEARVGIDLYNVSDLSGAAFRVLYDTTKLAFMTVEIGPFLGDEVFAVVIDTMGYVAVGLTLRGTTEVASGSGRLATIVVGGVAAGRDTLRFDTMRALFTTPTGELIPEASQMMFETGEIVVVP